MLLAASATSDEFKQKFLEFKNTNFFSDLQFMGL